MPLPLLALIPAGVAAAQAAATTAAATVPAALAAGAGGLATGAGALASQVPAAAGGIAASAVPTVGSLAPTAVSGASTLPAAMSAAPTIATPATMGTPGIVSPTFSGQVGTQASTAAGGGFYSGGGGQGAAAPFSTQGVAGTQPSAAASNANLGQVLQSLPAEYGFEGSLVAGNNSLLPNTGGLYGTNVAQIAPGGSASAPANVSPGLAQGSGAAETLGVASEGLTAKDAFDLANSASNAMNQEEEQQAPPPQYVPRRTPAQNTRPPSLQAQQFQALLRQARMRQALGRSRGIR